MSERHDDLPEVLERVAEAAGYDVAVKMARDFGGTRIYVPERVRPGSPLAVSIGIEAAEKIVRAFGRGDLMVPLGPRRHGARLRTAIAALLRQGMSNNQIARKIGVTERTVKRHRAALVDAGELQPRARTA